MTENMTIGLANGNRKGDGYSDFLRAVEVSFIAKVVSDPTLYMTDATNLFETFLENLPVEGQAHYNCRTCKHFFDRFGGLVNIDENGKLVPVLWDKNIAGTSNFFKAAVEALEHKVKKAQVTGVFLSDDAVLGTAETNGWDHLSVVLPNEALYRPKRYTSTTPYQAAAEKLEEFKMLSGALEKYDISHINQALAVLTSESVDRSEKFINVVEFLRDLKVAVDRELNTRVKQNQIWKAVSIAPTGFAHINSSMVGVLLDAIKSGASIESIRRSFNDKVDSTNYQRAKATPTDNKIKEDEKRIIEMGLERSLERRFARVDEIETVWEPELKPVTAEKQSVFGHLLQNKEETKPPLEVNSMNRITWSKFESTVLPLAEEIHLRVNGMYHHNSFGAIVTAVHEDAPPIIKWDREDRRNPFSWYLYHGGSSPNAWNLSQGYVKVNAISLQPSMWYDNDIDYLGKGLILILEGAKDTNYFGKGAKGNALFPEMLISQLHGMRSTLEHYSNNATLLGDDNEALASGLILSDGVEWDVHLRVKRTDGLMMHYKMDRWD